MKASFSWTKTFHELGSLQCREILSFIIRIAFMITTQQVPDNSLCTFLVLFSLHPLSQLAKDTIPCVRSEHFNHYTHRNQYLPKWGRTTRRVVNGNCVRRRGTRVDRRQPRWTRAGSMAEASWGGNQFPEVIVGIIGERSYSAMSIEDDGGEGLQALYGCLSFRNVALHTN